MLSESWLAWPVKMGAKSSVDKDKFLEAVALIARRCGEKELLSLLLVSRETRRRLTSDKYVSQLIYYRKRYTAREASLVSSCCKEFYDLTPDSSVCQQTSLELVLVEKLGKAYNVAAPPLLSQEERSALLARSPKYNSSREYADTVDSWWVTLVRQLCMEAYSNGEYVVVSLDTLYDYWQVRGHLPAFPESCQYSVGGWTCRRSPYVKDPVMYATYLSFLAEWCSNRTLVLRSVTGIGRYYDQVARDSKSLEARCRNKTAAEVAVVARSLLSLVTRQEN